MRIAIWFWRIRRWWIKLWLPKCHLCHLPIVAIGDHGYGECVDMPPDDFWDTLGKT